MPPRHFIPRVGRRRKAEVKAIEEKSSNVVERLVEQCMMRWQFFRIIWEVERWRQKASIARDAKRCKRCYASQSARIYIVYKADPILEISAYGPSCETDKYRCLWLPWTIHGLDHFGEAGVCTLAVINYKFQLMYFGQPRYVGHQEGSRATRSYVRLLLRPWTWSELVSMLKDGLGGFGRG